MSVTVVRSANGTFLWFWFLNLKISVIVFSEDLIPDMPSNCVAMQFSDYVWTIYIGDSAVYLPPVWTDSFNCSQEARPCMLITSSNFTVLQTKIYLYFATKEFLFFWHNSTMKFVK